MTTSTLFVAILALGLASAAAHANRRHRTAGVLKMTAASGYLALAVAGGAAGSRYGQFLLAGLVLCWLGDLLLIPEGRSRAFVGGLASFLLGHVAYACAFVAAGASGAWVAAAALPVGVVGAGVLHWLWRQPLPRPMRAPVVAYVVAISGMAALAWGAWGAGSAWLVPLGAMAFMASDIFVARQRFVVDSAWNTGIGLPLYFLGQALLALSV